MILSSAVRMAGRRLAANAGSRRVFSAAAASTAKNDNARKTLVATAGGLTLAVAALQQREVSTRDWVGLCEGCTDG